MPCTGRDVTCTKHSTTMVQLTPQDTLFSPSSSTYEVAKRNAPTGAVSQPHPHKIIHCTLQQANMSQPCPATEPTRTGKIDRILSPMQLSLPSRGYITKISGNHRPSYATSLSPCNCKKPPACQSPLPRREALPVLFRTATTPGACHPTSTAGLGQHSRGYMALINKYCPSPCWSKTLCHQGFPDVLGPVTR